MNELFTKSIQNKRTLKNNCQNPRLQVTELLLFLCSSWNISQVIKYRRSQCDYCYKDDKTDYCEE